MSISSLRKKFVPVGTWAPDSPEFAPGFLDQIVNVIPVYGVYRTLQKVNDPPHSYCPEPRRVTGTYVHRISEDNTIDIMQPVFSEAAIKTGFQSSPGSVGGGTLLQYWQALRGVSPDIATTVLLIPRDVEKTLYGNFSPPRKKWDTTTDLKAHYQFTLAKGFTGAYELIIEIGIVTGDPNLEAGFTVLGSFTQSGFLTDVGITGFPETGIITIPNASFTDPGNQHRYAWRIRHTIDASDIFDELDPDTAVSASVSGNPSSIAGYTTQAGSNAAADIVAAITGLVAGAWPDHVPGTARPGDDTFAISPLMWSTTPAGHGFYFKMPFEQYKNLAGHHIKMRYSMDSLAQYVGVALYQGVKRTPEDQAKELKRWGNRFDVIPTIGASIGYGDPSAAHISDTVMEIRLDLDDIRNDILHGVSNWDDVWLLFFTWPPKQGVGTTTNFFRSIQSSPFTQFPTNAPWTIIVPIPPATLPQVIGDQLTTTGLFSNPAANATNQSFRVRMGSFTGPKESVTKITVKIKACADEASMNPVFMTLGFYEPSDLSGQNFRGSESQPIRVANLNEAPIGMKEYSFEANRAAITQLGLQNMFAEVRRLAGTTPRLAVEEVWVELETGVSSRARLHGISYFAPLMGEGGAPAPIDVSWLRLDGPADEPDILGDTIKAYLGTVEEPKTTPEVGKIYEVGVGEAFAAWTDVSRVAGYSSNARDKSWSFCNFGALVIGTNYSDPVQAKYEGDLLFRDLIGFDAAGVPIVEDGLDYDDVAVGGVFPRARYAATINAFLCLANCDPLSVIGSATPYSFWCSRYAAPQYFHVGSTTWQSSVFQLVSTPGEITGLVGGEYGIIFKENSIWRVDYVQPPQVFDFVQISGEQGTTHPRSIVKVDADVYFWGIGGIYVVRNGQQIEELAAQGSVRKFLFDSQFEDFAVSTFKATLESEASAKVIGGYDTYTGCVFWAYQSKNAQDEWFECDSMLVYSPRENKFSFLRGDMRSPNFPTDRIVKVKDLFGTNQLKISGLLSLGNRQTEGQNYLMKTIMAVRDIPPTIVSFSGQPVYEELFRSNTISASFFGAPTGVEIEIQQVRPVLAIEDIIDPATQKRIKAPRYAIWIEASQSPVVGANTGDPDDPSELRYLDTGHTDETKRAKVNREGWIDLGQPLSGEFFKFAIAFAEHNEPIVKEVHGWQVRYRIAGDR